MKKRKMKKRREKKKTQQQLLSEGQSEVISLLHDLKNYSIDAVDIKQLNIVLGKISQQIERIVSRLDEVCERDDLIIELERIVQAERKGVEKCQTIK